MHVTDVLNTCIRIYLNNTFRVEQQAFPVNVDNNTIEFTTFIIFKALLLPKERLH